MSALDLEQMRTRWAEQSRRIDDSLVLDVEAVRTRLRRRVTTTLAWHRRRRVVGMVVACSCLVALSAFITTHIGQWQWVKIAALLVPLLLAEIVIDLREWLALRRLDLDAPVMRVREGLNRLRWRRLRLAKGYMLFSVLLWWPLILVLFKGLLGVDLLRGLPPGVLLVNLAAGLAFLPVALVVAGCLRRCFGQTPGWQSFLDDSAGRSWRRASDAFAEQDAFETAFADGNFQDAVGFAPLADEVRTDLRALRARLLVGIFGCAGLILLFGLFNVGHGGQVRFIASGTLLLWFSVAHMVVQIIHRHALSRLDGGAAGLRERLLAMMTVRRRLALATVLMVPMLVMPLGIVIAKLFGTDLIQVIPVVAQMIIAILALATSALLWRRIRPDPDAFAPGLIDVICFGFMGRARKLLWNLDPEHGGVREQARSKA